VSCKLKIALNMKRLLFAFTLILLIASYASAQQNEAVFAVVDESTYDFKTIKEADGDATHTFKIKNDGNAPLVISRVTTSCGCTTWEYLKEPVAPGETLDFKVIYNTTNRVGPFTRTIQVFSNGYAGSYILTIKGTVEGK